MASAMGATNMTLVTGGAGFLGSHVVDLLVAQGERVLVLDDLSGGRLANLRTASASGLVELVEASVLDEARVVAAISHARAIVHLASPIGVATVLDDPAHTIEVIVGGAQNVLRHAHRRGVPTLVASSSEVYGPGGPSPLSEEDRPVLGPPDRFRWAYATAKLASEQMALAYHARGLPVVIARLFNAVGPRQSAARGMVLPRFVSQALAGGPVTVHGDGLQTRCFCDVRDVTRALLALMATPAANGRVVNVGSAETTTIRALAERVVAIAGRGAIAHVPTESAYRAGFEEVRSRIPCLTLIEKLISFRPVWKLDASIADVVSALSSEAGRAAVPVDGGLS